MRKIIWGIAAVFCVQVAFQLAMTAERSDAEYAALQTPLRDPVAAYSQSVADYNDLDTSSVADYSDAEAATFVPSAVRHFTPAPVRIASYHRRTFRIEPTQFKPVVITYDTYDRTAALTEAAAFRGGGSTTPTLKSDVPAVKSDVPAKEDKRPLIAKIVTKPYDWMKTFASKLH